mmetsp:Transcript_19491/g.24543  ORF Transcript_19491/g.24543 Transcript_19491/m.24543 type:complete len:294 (-) Transcript_19491:204-1085(-)|eukprot:CAMPEP_0203658656 /NCGR_PEP_ID=MMETSP0088-20131115/48967_1 /ASSEMBLY_ACC=CAM_ASM_001087 /TAXON_ID=426623 /ORGANISM="Chaetoceros affinis, Strain CCMP159" /LENGTH=293 /DNA_ID=CAMNT_0050520399 /DNA_START=101 /DNA_END=982 /DNA_ORIENTATION=-
MPLKIPPDLKKITQYIRRAEELDRDETTPETRIVAYYCRQHAVQTGIPLATSPGARDCLGQILNDLEKEKKKMSKFTKKEAYQVCRGFAMKIFDKADSVDRAGQSDKGTAKTFYAAASFLDILSQFHSNSSEEDRSEDVLEEEKKSFYAKWKATDILKAIREGREIKPGGFGEDPLEHDDDKEDGEAEEAPAEQGTEISITGAAMPPPPYPGYEPVVPAAPFQPVPVPKPATGGFMGGLFGGGSSGGGRGKYTKEVLGDAKELTKFALTALNDKDGDLAIERLQQALEVLTNA